MAGNVARLSLVVAVGLSLAPVASAKLARTAEANQEVIVTRESQALPTGCTAHGLGVLVGGLFEAFNVGDWERVDKTFAVAGPAPPSFTLLSWQQDVVRERERVTPYLAALRARGEQLRLLGLLAEKESNSASVAVTYAFERPGGYGWGKGLIDCPSQRIWQWAMGPRSGELLLPCPKSRGWSPTGPAIACTAGPNAITFAPDFRVTSGSRNLPRPCAPTAAKRRLAAVLRVLNEGQGVHLAAHFATGGGFRPYTVERPIIGRQKLAEFVTLRYRAGDGWTATALDVPRTTVVQRFGATRHRVAVYRLSLGVSSPLKSGIPARANIVIDCRSGLIRSWVGPRIPAP